MKSAENPWKKCLETVSISEIGLRRSNNQDSYQEVPARNLKIWNSRGQVFSVADGMGAHAAGELASKMATDIIPNVYLKQTLLPPAEALTLAIQEANRNIHKKGNSDKELHGMGTTNDTLVILPEGAMIGHVGDSRVYRLRGKKWEQMTSDHSVVWAKEEAGEVIDETVHKNVITRCLGVSPEIKVDIEGPSPIMPGDIFLLCSDGLCGQFEDSEMGKILAVLPLPQAVRALVDLANLRGGPDNITVITVKYLGPQQAVSKADEKPLPPAAQTEMPLPPVPQWVWYLLAGAGTTFLLGLVSFMFSFLLGLVLVIAGGGGAAAAGGLICFRKPQKAFTRRYGKGPYRMYSAVCDEKFAGELKKIFKELYASVENQENLDLKTPLRMAQAASKALDVRNYEESTRNFALAISAIWRQLTE